MSEFRLEAHGVPIIGVRGPVPALKIQSYFRGHVDTDQGTGQPPAPRRQLIALDLISTVTINGVLADSVTLESGIRFGSDVVGYFNQEMKWTVRIPRYLLEAIESTRTHDVKVEVSVEIRYHEAEAPPFAEFRTGNAQLSLKVSEREWLDALGEMGYRGGWIVEVDRPEIEGWDGAVGFLSKAEDRISSHDAEGAIAQCRAAWKQLKPLLDGIWADVAVEVNRGSVQEDNYKTKAERIDDLRAAAISWANTGDHPEHYAASMEDALLAYRLTSSLMSFLSRKAKLAEGHRSATKGA